MRQNDTPFEHAMQVKRDHAAWLMAQPGVLGVGVGSTPADAPCIVVFTADEGAVTRAVGHELDGVPVITEAATGFSTSSYFA